MKTKSIAYRIHESKTGNVLLKRVELDSQEVENLSSDSPEGHFIANQCTGLEELGEQSVFAILL